MDVPAREEGEEVLLGQGCQLPLDEVDPLALERRRPIRMRQEVTGKVLTYHQLL